MAQNHSWLYCFFKNLFLCFSECKIDNCEACFNRNFCTKCKEGLYSHSGRCYVSCPPGQRTSNETMECVGEWPSTFHTQTRQISKLPAVLRCAVLYLRNRQCSVVLAGKNGSERLRITESPGLFPLCGFYFCWKLFCHKSETTPLTVKFRALQASWLSAAKTQSSGLTFGIMCC